MFDHVKNRFKKSKKIEFFLIFFKSREKCEIGGLGNSRKMRKPNRPGSMTDGVFFPIFCTGNGELVAACYNHKPD